jgi:hypothetical protein
MVFAVIKCTALKKGPLVTGSCHAMTEIKIQETRHSEH